MASVRLGAEIRRRRRALGMTQTELGHPLTRAFISAVETGRCLPSLGVLVLLAERLRTSATELLDPVKQDLSAVYTRRRAADRDPLART